MFDLCPPVSCAELLKPWECSECWGCTFSSGIWPLTPVPDTDLQNPFGFPGVEVCSVLMRLHSLAPGELEGGHKDPAVMEASNFSFPGLSHPLAGVGGLDIELIIHHACVMKASKPIHCGVWSFWAGEHLDVCRCTPNLQGQSSCPQTPLRPCPENLVI